MVKAQKLVNFGKVVPFHFMLSVLKQCDFNKHVYANKVQYLIITHTICNSTEMSENTDYGIRAILQNG